MKIRPKTLGYWLGLPLALLLLIAAAFWWYWFKFPFEKIAGLTYGQRDGKSLVLDVFRPPQQNGAGVLMMVSGGWKSGAGSIRPELFAPFLRRGYTVFAIQHISQPECTISGIVEDVTRAVRYVRHHAHTYGVDGKRLGVIGGSSGGHLSLMLGTTGGPGDESATDPVLKESAAVQCVACFYPPTFIVHGDADTLVPLDQSERFLAEAQKHNATIRLDVRPGQGHGWPSMIFDIVRFADWFDQHLNTRR